MRLRDEGGSSLVGTTAPLASDEEEEIVAVEGTMGVPVPLLEEVEKELDLSSSSMAIKEGVLMRSGVDGVVGNVLVVAEGFPVWLDLLDTTRCPSIACWCRPEFHRSGRQFTEVEWLDSCNDLRGWLQSSIAPRTILIHSSRGKVRGVDILHLVVNENLVQPEDVIIAVI